MIHKTILITAGPTREYIDPVRYLSNDSSGEMGFALAAAAAEGGARVILISGPVDLPTPPTVERIDVISAEQMLHTVHQQYTQADIIICAAAVSDFKPAASSSTKLKRRSMGENPTLALIPTPDSLGWLGNHKRNDQFLIGFALETENLIANARQKLAEKNCDLIVANHASTIRKSTTQLTLIDRTGTLTEFPTLSKSASAHRLLDALAMTTKK